MSLAEGKSMLKVLSDFVEKAARAEIAYMVTGSFAMSGYGEIRFTRDIDIVVELKPENIEEFIDLFKDDYYIDKSLARRAVRERKMFNIIHFEKIVKIDCIICRTDNEFEKLKFSRRCRTQVADIKFQTITKEDLILSNLKWAEDSFSEMQIKDIDNLTQTQYDADYVEFWIEKLGLQKIWRNVLEWKTRHEK